MSGPALTPSGFNENRDFAPQISGGASIIEQLLKVVAAIGKFGLATVIFAFPVVLGCYGLYFLWLAVATPQVNTGRLVVGIFATLFGPGLTILMLYVVTWLDLREWLLPKAQKSTTHRKAA